VWIVAVGAENALAHARVAGEICDGNPFQAQGPRSQQVKSAVPREIVNACGCLEEYDGLSRCGRREAGHASRDARDLEIIQPADESALEALGVKVFERHRRVDCNREKTSCDIGISRGKQTGQEIPAL
jgi:hypothetical protein